MSAVLRLESFTARSAAAPAPISPEQLAAARAEGFADGLAAGADAAAAGVADAIQALASALAAAEADRAARSAESRRELATLLRAVVVRLAPALRAEALAEQVVRALTSQRETPRQSCRIRCSEDLVAPLRQALADGRIDGVAVTAGDGPLEIIVPGGTLRIDMPTYEAALDRLVAEIGEGEN